MCLYERGVEGDLQTDEEEDEKTMDTRKKRWCNSGTQANKWGWPPDTGERKEADGL